MGDGQDSLFHEPPSLSTASNYKEWRNALDEAAKKAEEEIEEESKSGEEASVTDSESEDLYR